ncbi:chaperonin 10-like protein [Aspergillus cavernicola]|uniref:Chaperonin 10-like protein n=1 Tax=Aspergillus cavernicola TaxID=176166 RepID=A0ABR4IUF4_9EURO
MPPTNQAAWLLEAGSPLQVRDAPMPAAGPGEIVVKNAAVAINPLDCHMQDSGVFVQEWPSIFGCDVAGEVYEVGPDVNSFKKGDRVIGHAINLVSGRPEDGAFALYTVIPANKAAILPESIPFTDGVVVPFALEAAICTLCLETPGSAMPGVSTPALGLPYPTLQHPAPALNKTLIVYGGSSSVGSMVTQIATASGIRVISVAGKHNFGFAKQCGAVEVFHHGDPDVIEKVAHAVTSTNNHTSEPGNEDEFIGIFDAISTPETYAANLAILARLEGGHLACVHPPPSLDDIPGNVNVKTGMIFAVNDVATAVWRDYVERALRGGRLQCLPRPRVVGKGLEAIQGALEVVRGGVSAAKIVVEL